MRFFATFEGRDTRWRPGAARPALPPHRLSSMKGRTRSPHGRLARLVATIGTVALVVAWALAIVPPSSAPLRVAQWPGAIEMALVAAIRVSRTTAVEHVVHHVGVYVLPVAGAMGAWLAWRVTGQWIPACATAMAMTLALARAPQSMLLTPAVVLVAIATVWALIAGHSESGLGAQASRHDVPPESTRMASHEAQSSAWLGWLGLAVTAAVMPQTTPIMALLGGWHVGQRARAPSPRRWLIGLTAGVVLAVTAAGGLALLPSPPPAMRPSDEIGRAAWSTPSLDALRRAVEPTGLFGISLALLGLFMLRNTVDRRRHAVASAYVVLPASLSLWPGTDHERVLAPLAAGGLVLVSAGLGEVIRACRARRLGTAAAALFVVLVPAHALNGVRAAEGRALGPRPREGTSLDEFLQAHRALPYQSVVVVGDAVADLLLRASEPSWRRAGKIEATVTAHPSHVSDVLAQGHHQVFAWSDTTWALQLRGLRALSRADLTLPAAAELKLGAPCAVLGPDWIELPSFTETSQFTLFADAADEFGPVLIYTAADRASEATPMEWPQTTTYGFHRDLYRTDVGPERTALEAVARVDGLPDTSLVWTKPVVTRFMLWRTPDAPRALRVDLALKPRAVVARMHPDSRRQRLTVCPTFVE